MTERENTRRNLNAMAVAGAVIVMAASLFASQDDGGVSAGEEFLERVNAYVEVRNKVAGHLQAGGAEAAPETIAAVRKAMADAIGSARPDAEPGDIFTPRIQEHFRALIAEAFDAPGDAGAAREVALGDGNPEHEPEPDTPPVVLRVNAEYPVDAPLSTMPPTLLQRLPLLPEELEYRFVGPDLILRDKNANIIVDYMRDAASPA